MSMKRNANLPTTVKPLLNSELLISYNKKVLISFSWMENIKLTTKLIVSKNSF